MADAICASIKQVSLQLVQGDITHETTDAIVNAANSSLLGGGGVDGAIHRAAGPRLLEATRQLGGCATGDAKITPGFGLPARYVIHAVGPVYNPINPNTPKLLASAYRRSLEITAEHQLSSIAFPAISTGVYRYPVKQAAHISLETICQFIQDHQNELPLSTVRMVLFSDQHLQAFQDALTIVAAQFGAKTGPCP